MAQTLRARGRISGSTTDPTALHGWLRATHPARHDPSEPSISGQWNRVSGSLAWSASLDCRLARQLGLSCEAVYPRERTGDGEVMDRDITTITRSLWSTEHFLFPVNMDSPDCWPGYYYYQHSDPSRRLQGLNSNQTGWLAAEYLTGGDLSCFRRPT